MKDFELEKRREGRGNGVEYFFVVKAYDDITMLWLFMIFEFLLFACPMKINSRPMCTSYLTEDIQLCTWN